MLCIDVNLVLLALVLHCCVPENENLNCCLLSRLFIVKIIDAWKIIRQSFISKHLPHNGTYYFCLLKVHYRHTFMVTVHGCMMC